MATLDTFDMGVCHIEVIPAPRATQRDTYCGQDGVAVLDGGSRGGHFRIRGVLVASDLPTLLSFEAQLKSFADGQLHALVDTQGRTWPYCYFPGDYHPSPEGPKITDFGWCLPYTMTMESIL